MEIIGDTREQKKDRYYSMTIGIKEYLCQIVDEDEHVKFKPTIDSKTHKETIKSFEPKGQFIIIKNVVWLLPTPNGDAPIDYDSLSTGSDEVVVNVSAIQKLNLLPDRVTAEISQEKRAAKLGLVSPNSASADMTSRKGGAGNGL
jgi:hypothetical protein